MSLVEPATLDAMLAKYGVAGISIALLVPSGGDAAIRTQTAGVADRGTKTPMFDSTWLEIASLSKTIAGAFACEYFESRGLPMATTPVNPLLREVGSPFQLKAAAGQPAEWAEQVMLAHLLDHTGLGMHYVNGVPLSDPFPPIVALISGSAEAPAPYGYASIDLTRAPGTSFSYSGGGFLVLQHLLELREGKPIAEILTPHLDAAGAAVSLGLSFHQARRAPIVNQRPNVPRARERPRALIEAGGGAVARAAPRPPPVTGARSNAMPTHRVRTHARRVVRTVSRLRPSRDACAV